MKRYGMSQLELGASMDKGMRGPLCALTLIFYHAYVTFMFGNFFLFSIGCHVHSRPAYHVLDSAASGGSSAHCTLGLTFIRLSLLWAPRVSATRHTCWAVISGCCSICCNRSNNHDYHITETSSAKMET